MLPSSPIKLVDFGACEIAGGCELGNVRAAWAYWGNSRQWHVVQTANRVLLIEGQPDRLPHAGEPIERWLEGRSGSFRGFEITQDGAEPATTILVFTDPLCTRPLYYLPSSSSVCIADKLSTVVLNSDRVAEADWGGLLESAMLGSLYSHKTTVKGAVWLGPGECLELRGRAITRRWKNPLPEDSSLCRSDVAAHPAETLRLALEKAIAETWTDPEMRLLLSGGLDSRILLALASGRRKTLTVNLYSEETRIAEQVAAAADSELEIVPPPDYEFPVRWAYLATGAMHDSLFVHHLELVKDWRRRGISGITHGYFHNTMYRGWTAAPYERHPFFTSVLHDLMGRNAYYLERYACKQAAFQRDLYRLLSADGKAVLHHQLRELSDSLVPVVVDGYDLTFERRLLEFVPRQTYFSSMLAWYEGLDVSSPVFQPSVWTWYAFSSPRHRARDWAIREVYLSLDHPAARIADANTGQPIAHLPANWRDNIRNQFWYPPLRTAWLKLFWKPLPFQHGGMDWGNRLRQPSVLSAFEDALGVLRDNPLFDGNKVQAALEAYRGGKIDWVDSICALTAVGQWQRLLAQPNLHSDHIRPVELEAPVLSRREFVHQAHMSGESTGA